MKKFFCLFLIMILLTGCVKFDSDILTRQLDEFLATLDIVLDTRVNNRTEYFDYYLPSDMAESDCVEESVLVSYSNSKIIMNVNVANLISSNFYHTTQLLDEGFFDENRILYNYEGYYLNRDSQSVLYFLKIYDNDDSYFIHLMTGEFNLYANSLKEETYETVKHMFLLVRSATIEKEKILANYSSGEVISFARKQVDLFQYVIPKTGYLSELLLENEESSE